MTLAAYEIVRENVLSADPEHPLFSVQGGEQRTRGIELEGNARLTDALEVRFGFSTLDPAYTLFDLTASYSTTIASTPLRFGLTANNVADKRHVTSCYLTDFTHWCWFGAERTVEASVQARF
jgi:outer membrane receptor protein involved in Fe transport